MFDNIKELVLKLNSANVAFISVCVTVFTFLFARYNEVRFKKHELKKKNYMKFIDMLKKSYTIGNDFYSTPEFKDDFFKLGSTVFIYGSKKMYKKYCFFREFTSDIVKKCKYYNEEDTVYLIADMLNQIRKEIGLYNFEFPLNYNSIAFFTNGIYFNPLRNLKWWKCKISVFLVKFELFMQRVVMLSETRIFIEFICAFFKFISILFKYLFMIPLGFILKKIFK